jgi:hypothetical protein
VNLLPIERLTLACSLTPDEALQKLRDLARDHSHGLFRGRVEGRRFKLTRHTEISASKGREMFRAVLVGEVAPASTGATIRVLIRLRVEAMVLLGALWGEAAWFVALSVWSGLRNGFDSDYPSGKTPGEQLLVFGIWFVVLYLLVRIPFAFFAREARKWISRELSCVETLH